MIKKTLVSSITFSNEMADEKLIGMTDKVRLDSETANGKQASNDDDKSFQPTAGLKRHIGIVGCSALLVGTIIGSGIFASPKSVSSYAISPGASLLIWCGCGALAVLASLSYCELGTMYPNASGGEYYYLYQAFGPVPAFLFSYTQIIVVKPSQLAIIAITCGDYILVAANGGVSQLYGKLIAAALIGKFFHLIYFVLISL